MSHLGAILIQSDHDIAIARQMTKRLSSLARLSIGNQARLVTAVSQASQSLYLYHPCVHVSFDTVVKDERPHLQVTVTENKPGAAASVSQGGDISRDDLMKLLEGVRMIVRIVSIETIEGEPIRVSMAKPLPPSLGVISDEMYREWAGVLEEEPFKDPMEVILQENRTLAEVLDELREKEATLEKKLLEVEALERSRDNLVHALVHDLRNPLSSIRTSLSGLLHYNKSGLSQYQQMMVEISYLSAKKMTRLVDNILEVYKLEGENLVIASVHFSISAMIERLLHLEAPLLQEKEILVETHVPEDLPPIDGDVELLERVIQNLLDNAIRFTPSGGSIRIKVERQLSDDHRSARVDYDRFIVVRIHDSGPGVPDGMRLTLFEKFSTTKGQESGSGLGLAFCKLVIQAHGGDIWLEEAGEGAEFVFLLPAADVARAGSIAKHA